MNIRETWDAAARINLYGFLGHGKGINEKEMRKIAYLLRQKFFHGKIETLVNAGCGICSFDVYLSKYVNQIIAIDVSPEIIKKARERLESFNVKNIHLVLGDIRNLPLRRSISDATLSLGVLKHLPDNPFSTYRALSEMIRVTKRNRRIHVNDLPNLLCVDGVISRVVLLVWTKLLRRFTAGTFFYTPMQLKNLSSACKKTYWYGCGWRLPGSSLLSVIPFFGRLSKRLYIEPVSTTYKFNKVPLSFSSLEVVLET